MTLSYCKDLLTNRENYKKDILLKDKLHELRMKEHTEGDMMLLDEETFMKSWNFLKQTRQEKYKFLFWGGDSIRKACLKICQTIWKTEVYPNECNTSTLIQIDKGKQDQKDLANKRFIHIRDEFSKLFCHIVITKVKEEVMKNMTKFQIGSKTGHMPAEHIFVITSYMALCEKRKKAAIIQMMDYSKFYDRESLRDCLAEIHKNNVKGKTYRLLYKMNKENII